MTGNPKRETPRKRTNAEIARERERKALDLRRAGLSYDRIATAVGYANKSAAWKAINRALENSRREAADELLTLELDRLDHMSVQVYANALKGDTRAITTVLKIMERRAKLLNLDNPSSTDKVKEASSLLDAIQSQLDGPDTYVPVSEQEVPE